MLKARLAAFFIGAVFALQPASGRPSAGVFEEPVAISAEQASLLKDEAAQLQLRTDAATTQLADRPFAPETVRALVVKEQSVLADVQSRFLKSATAPQRSAGTVYFGDLGRRYARLAGQISQFPEARWDALRSNTFDVMSVHYKAYTLVSASGLLTFDLLIASSQPGAGVSYRRAGGAYEKHPDGTNTTIVNLPYALWTVRAELKGAIQEKDHDPYRESNHVVHFDF